MNEVKISIIGAGSAVFSLNLVRDIILTPNLNGSTISLMDINEERLNAVYLLGKRYINEANAKFKFEKTTNRRESLKDADFVINTALVAGHDRLKKGWEIAKKYDYRFGGSFHVMHDEAFWINFYQFKLFDSILNDVLEVSPNAWYVQLANPVLAGITYLSRKYKKVKIVGLCHGFTGVYHLADVLGLKKEEISFQIPGVNHFIWLTHFCYRGENAFPIIDNWIRKEATTYWKKCYPSCDLGPKAIDLYQKFGVFPIGDTCTPGGGSWPWWYHINEENEKRWNEDPKAWWESYFAHGKRRVEELINLSKDTSASVSNRFPLEKSNEIIVPLIESIVCDIPRVLQVNIQNSNNFVPGIPSNFEVEIPALVSKKGIQGIETEGLPKPLTMYAIRDRVAPVEVELEAYESKNKELLVELLMMDPWTKSRELAVNFLEDILSLPYHEDMRKHYK
ncbi:MAG: alpha-glucosidase/alpha-galactosidase [Thaumarchaeota archaeon]|nr:alpha-glucosidase/alpha-galactosidase [Nitrososphaerota archaeon]